MDGESEEEKDGLR